MNRIKLLLAAPLFVVAIQASAQTAPAPGAAAQAACAAHPDQCAATKSNLATAKNRGQDACAADPTACANRKATMQTRETTAKARRGALQGAAPATTTPPAQ